MLWNVIYEFFVKYVFGGYNPRDGIIYYVDVGTEAELSTLDLQFPLFEQSFDLSSYLCLIATIISMVVILVICCAFIKKVYNMCAHIIN